MVTRRRPRVARRVVPLVLAATVAACGPPPRVPATGLATADADTAATLWGDEYDGLSLDRDLDPGLGHGTTVSAEALAGATTAWRVLSARGPLEMRYRGTHEGHAGAVQWHDARVHLVAGAVRPVAGEGVVIADARDAGAFSPSATRSIAGLRLAPSSSLWGSLAGAGVAYRAGAARFSWAAWAPRDEPARRVTWGSVEWRTRAWGAGVAAGRSLATASTAASVFAGRALPDAFVSMECGVTPSGAGMVGRVVAGPASEWRVLVSTGPVPSAEDPASPAAAERLGGAVERRYGFGGVRGVVAVSSRMRRIDGTDEVRRRIEWTGSARAGAEARVEFGVRATRTLQRRARSTLAESQAPTPAPGDDDLRARVALHATHAIGEAVTVSNLWRVDAIHAGGERAGVVTTWKVRVRRGGVDLQFQAGAFDLRHGQLGYAGRVGLPGAGSFATLSGRGSEVSAAVRWRWRALWVGGSWRDAHATDAVTAGALGVEW